MIVQTREGIIEVTNSYGRRMVEMGQAIMLPDYIQPDPIEKTEGEAPNEAEPIAEEKAEAPTEAATEAEEPAAEAEAPEEPAPKKTRKKG